MPTMKLFLRDRSPELVEEWKLRFRNLPDVEVSEGNLFDITADAVVSPANSFCFMNGGVDQVIEDKLHCQETLQEKLKTGPIFNGLCFEGELLVGQALAIEVQDPDFKYLISAPTMRVPMEIPGTINVYLAFRAALSVAKNYEGIDEDISKKHNIPPINSLLSPGMGTGVGRITRNWQ
jgi:O-acetyl-ADP-ribose deacetylase (regulator of RNase III)